MTTESHNVRFTPWQDKDGFYEARAFSLAADAWDTDTTSHLVVIPHEMGGWKWTVSGDKGIEGTGRCDDEVEGMELARDCALHRYTSASR